MACVSLGWCPVLPAVVMGLIWLPAGLRAREVPSPYLQRLLDA